MCSALIRSAIRSMNPAAVLLDKDPLLWGVHLTADTRRGLNARYNRPPFAAQEDRMADEVTIVPGQSIDRWQFAPLTGVVPVDAAAS